MASNSIVASRLGTLAELGEEGVFATYLRVGSVRRPMMELFEPHGGASAGAACFYKWLEQEDGRRDRWERLLEVQGQLDADKALEVARAATPQDANAKKLLVDTLRWRAGAC